MKCPSCGFDNPDRNIFCSFCGFRMPERVAPESVGAVPAEEPVDDPVEEPVAEATVEPEEVVEPQPEPVAGPEPKDEPKPEPHKAPESVPSPGTAPKHSSSTSSRKTDRSETSLTEDNGSRLRIAAVAVILIILVAAVLLLIPKTYDVNVRISGDGTVTGTGTYEEGTVVELVAEGEDPYDFVSWSDGVTDPVRTITVDHDWNLTAIFERFYDVKIVADPEGSDHQDGKVLHVKEGTILEITPDPVQGKRFEYWMYNGHEVYGDTFEKAVYGDMTVYIITSTSSCYVETWSENPEWGEFAESSHRPYGSRTFLWATPKLGYEFLGWYEDGKQISDTSQMFYYPYEDVRLEARFGIIHDPSFTVTEDPRVGEMVFVSSRYNIEIEDYSWEVRRASDSMLVDVYPTEYNKSGIVFTPLEPMHLIITRNVTYTDGETGTYSVEVIINAADAVANGLAYRVGSFDAAAT